MADGSDGATTTTWRTSEPRGPPLDSVTTTTNVKGRGITDHYSVLLIVLVVGIAVVLAMMLIGFFVANAHNTTLENAETAVSQSVEQIVNSLETFCVTIVSALQRVVTKIGVIFEQFLGLLARAFTQVMTYFVNGLAKVLGSVEKLAVGIFGEMDKVVTQVGGVIVQMGAQVAGTLATMPTQIGLTLSLDFVNLVTDGIRKLYCYVVTGIEEVTADVTKITGQVVAGVESGLSSVTSFFQNIGPNFQQYVLQPIVNDLNTQIMQPITNDLINPIKNGITDGINDIKSVVDKISSAFP